MTQAARTDATDDWAHELEHRWREYERLVRGTSWVPAEAQVGAPRWSVADEPITMLGPIAVVW